MNREIVLEHLHTLRDKRPIAPMWIPAAALVAVLCPTWLGLLFTVGIAVGLTHENSPI